MFFGETDEEEGLGFSEGGAVKFSFAHLEREAARSTGQKLKDLDDKLYDGPITPPAALSHAPESDQHEHGGINIDRMGGFRRFADNEYAAHTDSMGDRELREWQSNFNYLRVVGKAYIVTPSSATTSAGAGAMQGVQFIRSDREDEDEVDVENENDGVVTAVAPLTDGDRDRIRQASHTDPSEDQGRNQGPNVKERPEATTDVHRQHTTAAHGSPHSHPQPPASLPSTSYPSPRQRATGAPSSGSSSGIGRTPPLLVESPPAGAQLTVVGVRVGVASGLRLPPSAPAHAPAQHHPAVLCARDGERMLVEAGQKEGEWEWEWEGGGDGLPTSRGILDDTLEWDQEDRYTPARARAATAAANRHSDAAAAAADGDKTTPWEPPVEPIASQCEEVISILTDALWPDIVQALEPLVRRLVTVSRPLGAALYSEPSRGKEKKEGTGAGEWTGEGAGGGGAWDGGGDGDGRWSPPLIGDSEW